MRTVLIATALALTASPALAQQGGMAAMPGMDQSGGMQATAADPFPPAEMDMRTKMMSAIGADASETWVRKMIEHHRGGIAMSRIVLAHNPEPMVRQMATKTIAEQTKEVGELNGWLRAHGKPAE